MGTSLTIQLIGVGGDDQSNAVGGDMACAGRTKPIIMNSIRNIKIDGLFGAYIALFEVKNQIIGGLCFPYCQGTCFHLFRCQGNEK